MRLAHAPQALASLRTPTLASPWRVLLSGCIAGHACGVDGTDYGLPAQRPSWLASPLVEVVPFCPEDAGLGTPRGMPDLHGGDGFDVLDGRATIRDPLGRDLTAGMIAGAEAMLRVARERAIDFALLTDRSGACGTQVVSLGCRFEAPVRHRFGVGVAAALLLRHGFAVVSQRDFATLQRLHARLDPGFVPDPTALDHHESAWVRDNLGDPLALLAAPALAPTREALAELLRRVAARSGPGDADLLRRAAFWMVRAHLHQAPRPDGSPYVAHPTGVATTLLEWCPDAPVEALVAALLHDGVEDQAEAIAAHGPGEGETSEARALAAIEQAFGPRVRSHVAGLTHGPGPYAEHVRAAVHADPWVAAIKLADLGSNAWRLGEIRDPERRARLTAKYRPVMELFVELVRELDADHPLAPARERLRAELATVWARDYAP